MMAKQPIRVAALMAAISQSGTLRFKLAGMDVMTNHDTWSKTWEEFLVGCSASTVDAVPTLISTTILRMKAQSTSTTSLAHRLLQHASADADLFTIPPAAAPETEPEPAPAVSDPELLKDTFTFEEVNTYSWVPSDEPSNTLNELSAGDLPWSIRKLALSFVEHKLLDKMLSDGSTDPRVKTDLAADTGLSTLHFDPFNRTDVFDVIASLATDKIALHFFGRLTQVATVGAVAISEDFFGSPVYIDGSIHKRYDSLEPLCPAFLIRQAGKPPKKTKKQQAAPKVESDEQPTMKVCFSEFKVDLTHIIGTSVGANAEEGPATAGYQGEDGADVEGAAKGEQEQDADVHDNKNIFTFQIPYLMVEDEFVGRANVALTRPELDTMLARANKPAIGLAACTPLGDDDGRPLKAAREAAQELSKARQHILS